jgi:diguanylate cyclase (GGDEF)-like protein
VDLDGLGAVNESHGHAAGDLALKRFADAAAAALRNVDIIGRYGGKEFIAIMPDTDLKGALIAAERIRAAVGREPLPEVKDRRHLSCTLGVAEHRKGENTRLLIGRAESRAQLRQGRGTRPRGRAGRRWQADAGRDSLMAGGKVFGLDASVVFRGKPMRIAGRMLLEGASGQSTFRYLLSGGAGAPVLLEQAASDRYALLRPFPPAAEPQTAGNTVAVGAERYTLVGVRRLKVLDALGQSTGAAPGATMLLSGMFEGPAGTLMRELVPGSDKQVYYLVKPLAAGDLLSAEEHAARREAARRAAGEADDD